MLIKAGLVGVSGYTGMELARLLAFHPQIKLTHATSRQEAGRRLDELYPFMRSLPGGDLIIEEGNLAELAKDCDLVFLAVPHGVAMDSAAVLCEAGAKVIDLSADFRLRDPAVFAAWYHSEHRQPQYLPQAVYGLPELYADKIREARLIANPGCYPTASILGLCAALEAGIIESDNIVIDAKSGSSGAGRKAATSMLFCEVSDSFKPYNLGKHRHTPEIEQEVSRLAGQAVTLSFNPHLLPINRGILATIYTKLNRPLLGEEVQYIFERHWAGQPWIRVLPYGSLPETKNVRGSMFCDISVTVDERCGRLIICSAIDNICRGASGQAIANANLLCGLPINSGLDLAPLMP